MAAQSAKIGAVNVDLGLNTGQFTAGMKQAQNTLGKFGVQLTYSLNGIVEKVGELVSAFPEAIKGAIDHADALNKAAQKAGTTVEALSRLEYAAKLSDTSLEGLTGGLEKLSKSMLAVASGSGPVTAFKALGISVVDAAGHLRDTNDVFADVADRFSRMEDGAQKTALAIQIFGKTGAELIPLLNEGREGLKGWADESDRVGQTISTKTAQAAEKFNDTLTRVGLAFQGIINQVAAGVLPTLQSVADALTDPKLAQAAVDFGMTIVNAVKEAIPYLQNLFNNLSAIHDLFASFEDMSKRGQQNAIVDLQNQVTVIENRIDANRQKLAQGGAGTLFGLNDAALQGQIDKDIAAVQPLIDKIDELHTKMAGNVLGAGTGAVAPSSFDFGGFLNSPKSKPYTPPIIDAKAAVSSLNVFDIALVNTRKKTDELIKAVGDGLTGAVQSFADAVLQGTDPVKAFASELANLGQQLLNAGIQSIIGSIFKPSPLAFVPGTGFAQLQPHANGGPVSLGSPYLVGERGPELFVPGASGTIIPNHALGGGGSTVIQVQLDPGLVGGILKQAGEQSVQIVKKNAPSSVARAQFDNRRGG